MLITRSQLGRINNAFPPGSVIHVGSAPVGENRDVSPGWASDMDSFAGRSHYVRGVSIIDQPILADGRVMYDVQITLKEAKNGAVYAFNLDWFDDAVLKEILDNPRGMKVEISQDKPAPRATATKAAAPKPSELGLLAAAGGAFAAILGVSALKNRKTKKNLEELGEQLRKQEQEREAEVLAVQEQVG